MWRPPQEAVVWDAAGGEYLGGGLLGKAEEPRDGEGGPGYGDEQRGPWQARAIVWGEPGEVEEITILSRKLAWKGNEMKYEADPKHAEMISR